MLGAKDARFYRFISQLLGAFLENSLKLLSLFGGCLGGRNLLYPRSHLFTGSAWIHSLWGHKGPSFPLTHVNWVTTPHQPQSSPWAHSISPSVRSCSLPFPTFSSFPFLSVFWMSGSQKHSLRNTLHADIHLIVFFPGDPTYNVEGTAPVPTCSYSQARWYLYSQGLYFWSFASILRPILHQYLQPDISKCWLSRSVSKQSSIQWSLQAKD